jgi:hypothetical protein
MLADNAQMSLLRSQVRSPLPAFKARFAALQCNRKDLLIGAQKKPTGCNPWAFELSNSAFINSD